MPSAPRYAKTVNWKLPLQFPRDIVIALAIAPCLATSLAAQTPAPVGVEFQINASPTGDQEEPAVAPGVDGGFVVVWESENPSENYSDNNIQARRFASNGTPIGDEFTVNSIESDFEANPDVAADSSGRFVIVWRSYRSLKTGVLRTVQGQRFESDGTPIAAQFQVNTYTSSTERVPVIAMATYGSFVVIWESRGSPGDSSSSSIQGQRYASDGSPLGDQFLVNSYTTGGQVNPSVAMEPGGGFVVVWAGDNQDYEYGISGQRYASDGSALGGQIQINSYPSSYNLRPSVAISPDGGFVVVWQGEISPATSGYSIEARRFAPDGAFLGEQFQVNTNTTTYPFLPTATVRQDGGFLVAWSSVLVSRGDLIPRGLRGRSFNADGSMSGKEFQINTFTEDPFGAPKLAKTALGDLVTVWQSEGAPGGDPDHSIRGQRLTFQTHTIFEDGFESGDVSAWSSSVTSP